MIIEQLDAYVHVINMCALVGLVGINIVAYRDLMRFRRRSSALIEEMQKDILDNLKKKRTDHVWQ